LKRAVLLSKHLERSETMATERKATLTVPGETPVHFPVIVPTHGRDCLDIRTLGTRTGRFAYDSGFESTASCKSKITFIDGQQGELLYRGYPVEQLARHCDFLEVACLLKNGELPDTRQKQAFDAAIRKNAPVHEQMVKFYQGFRRDARPMSVMVGVVGALSAFHHEAADFSDAEERNLSFHRIVARMPTIVAMAYKYSIGEPFMSPRHDLGYAANFLYMMFATPPRSLPTEPGPRARPRQAAHRAPPNTGRMPSTSTVRMAGSSGANPFACVSAAIASLSRPAHGGASEACLAQLAAIGDVSCVAQFVARARDESDSFRLTGFGPSVYSSFDPRAKLLREVCDEILPELGLEDHRLFKVARALEKVALEDPYFVEHKLYPNVDFYSGILQKALGIPPSMFACTLALARTPGWMAHWEEMLDDAEFKIARPRQLYTGVSRRHLMALSPSRNG
jgi:citrate synthase